MSNKIKDSLMYYRYNLRYELGRTRHNLFLKLVWKLPRDVAYWSAIRVIAHATTGPWSNQIVPDLTAMDSLQRWDKDNGRG